MGGRFSFIGPVVRQARLGKAQALLHGHTAGLPPTTDPDAIAEALNVRGPIVVFSTYQSSEVLEAALKKAGRPFDLMIADEAHNTTSAGLTSPGSSRGSDRRGESQLRQGVIISNIVGVHPPMC